MWDWGEFESWPLPQPGVKQKYDLSAGDKKSTPLSSPKGAGLEVEGASGYTCLFTTGREKGRERKEEKPDLRAATLCFSQGHKAAKPRELQGLGSKMRVGKKAGRRKRIHPSLLTLGEAGETGVGVGDTPRLQRSVLSQPAPTYLPRPHRGPSG